MAYSLETLGAQVRAMRRARGLSQKQLSDLAGVPQAHISRIECGGVDLRLSSLVAIAHALDHEFAVVPLGTAPRPQDAQPARRRIPPLIGELDYNG